MTTQKKKTPRLVRPNVQYKNSFLDDFLHDNDRLQEAYELTGISKKDVVKQFTEFVKRLRLQAKGVFSRKGLVPQTVFWLVKGKTFLGRACIRHNIKHPDLKKFGGHIGYYIRPDQRGKGYGKLILALALKKAKTLGIKNVLITCDLTNIKSKKVIESQGGKLESTVYMGRGKPKKLKFWIKT